MKKKNSMKTVQIILASVLCLLTLSSCSMKRDRLETELGYERLYEQLREEEQALIETRAREQEIEKQAGQNATLDLEPVLPSYNPLDEVMVSINVQEETLHNVLFVIARNAGLNLVIEPGISLDNKITVSFERAVSSLVIEKLLQAYDLSWDVNDNILYVQKFTEETFMLDFLNSRIEVEMDNGGDIYGSSLAEDASGNMSGNFQVKSSAGKGMENNSLYHLLLQGVGSIITGTSQQHEAGSGEASSTADESGTGLAESSYGSYALDPVSGTLYVKTTPSRMRAVAGMIDNFRKRMTRQVVIDARIVEVKLSDEFKMGIDWRYITERIIRGFDFDLDLSWNGLNDSPTLGSDSQPLSIVSPRSGTFTGDTLTATIEALQTFGGVKVVSNPHVRARHGQPALFTSGTSQNYVRSITRETDEEGDTTFEIEVSQVFDGVMLGVIPYIADNDVDLQIFPIKSEVDQTSLSLVDVTGDGDRITLPKIEIKNVSTNVRVKSGDTIILGGLIDKDTSKQDEGVPGIGRIPIIGWLFNTRADTEQVRELVIIMKIRVI